MICQAVNARPLRLCSTQRKEHCDGIEPHLHKPHFPDMLLTLLLPVVQKCKKPSQMVSPEGFLIITE